jgi:hypothetical protein
MGALPRRFHAGQTRPSCFAGSSLEVRLEERLRDGLAMMEQKLQIDAEAMKVAAALFSS